MSVFETGTTPRVPARFVKGIAFGAVLLLTAQAAGAADKELVFAGFGGSLQKALQSTVIPAFEKKYDVHVIYVTGTSNQILAKVRAQKAAPQIDVIWANDTTHYQGKAEKLFAKLDPAKVTNLGDVYKFARDPKDIGVAMGIQAVALEYNKEIFKEKNWKAPDSWMDLWDPRYKGHIMAYNMPIGYANMVLVEVAKLNGGSAEKLEPGWQKLKELVPNALAFVEPPAQVDAQFMNKSAWIAFNGSARIHDLAAHGVPVAMASPKEGALLYPQQFDVVAGAPHPTLAQQFINFTLSPEMQQQIAKSMLLGPVNRTVKLDDATAAKVPYGPKEVESLVHLDMDPINANLAQLTSHWTRVIGGQ